MKGEDLWQSHVWTPCRLTFIWLVPDAQGRLSEQAISIDLANGDPSEFVDRARNAGGMYAPIDARRAMLLPWPPNHVRIEEADVAADGNKAVRFERGRWA